MSRGKRYSEEPHLNYTKVFAVIIAIVVIAMCIVIIKNLLSKQKENDMIIEINENSCKTFIKRFL